VGLPNVGKSTLLASVYFIMLMILYIKKFIIVQNLSQVKLGTKAQKKANKIIIPTKSLI
jgi:ribosome-binding ATPase YchF (GTP1/OBG family)